MPARLKVGTKSTCRHCKAPVIWRPGRSVEINKAWRHLDPDFINDETPEPMLDEDIYCNLTDSEKEIQASRPEYMARRYHGHTTAEPATFCSVWVEDVPPYGPCNRKIQDEELMMCGVHARHKREGIRASERTHQSTSYRNYHEEELRVVLRDIEKTWGLKVELETQLGLGPDGGRGYTGKGLVDVGKLLEVLRVTTKNTHL